MNKIDRVKKIIRDISGEELFGVLATVKGSAPYTTLVAFVLQDDLKKLFFATPRDTKKFKHLTDNELVSFLIHNSTNSPEDTGNAIGITITGRASEHSKKSSKELIDLYLSKHPQMGEFVFSLNTAFICIDIERYDMVERFQNVTVLNMKDQVIDL